MKNNIKALQYMMKLIVQECLYKYNGGSIYFTELDKMIKNNEALMILFLAYAIKDSGCHNIIMSGEIGFKYLKMQLEHKLPKNINIMVVNGGLRNNKNIVSVVTNFRNIIPKDFNKNKVIFIDDSFYSGRTANKVEEFVRLRNGNLIRKYVFYDGCKEKHNDVISLYRYYK